MVGDTVGEPCQPPRKRESDTTLLVVAVALLLSNIGFDVFTARTGRALGAGRGLTANVELLFEVFEFMLLAANTTSVGSTTFSGIICQGMSPSPEPQALQIWNRAPSIAIERKRCRSSDCSDKPDRHGGLVSLGMLNRGVSGMSGADRIDRFHPTPTRERVSDDNQGALPWGVVFEVRDSAGD